MDAVRIVAGLLLAAASAACAEAGPPIPEEELAVRILVDSSEVELGRGFPLTVVRVWEKELLVEDWNEGVLEPLALRPLATTRREDGRRIEETRRYEAYAFAREALEVPAPSFRAWPRAGGPERVASGDLLHLFVKPALPADAAGAPELPGEPLPLPAPEPRGPVSWMARGLLLLALLLVAYAVRRRVLRARALREAALAAASVPAAPAPPHLRALERLARLRELEPRTAEELDAFHVEASALVREFLEERFAIRAPEMTTQELLAGGRGLTVERELLSRVLTGADRVKFGRHRPTAPERESLLQASERLVLAAAGEQSAVPGTP